MQHPEESGRRDSSINHQNGTVSGLIDVQSPPSRSRWDAKKMGAGAERAALAAATASHARFGGELMNSSGLIRAMIRY